MVSMGGLQRNKLHAELGHILVMRHADDPIGEPQDCIAHAYKGCLESYVSLPALRKRWPDDVQRLTGKSAPPEQMVELVAFYVAQLCVNLILMSSPTHIRFSGRVVKHSAMFQRIREITCQMLKMDDRDEMYPGYAENEIQQMIGRREHAHSGVFGCTVLANQQAREGNVEKIG